MADPSGYTPRVAIITGSARGLGFAIAQKLADDGVDVVINDLPSELEKINDAVEEIKKKGRKAIGIPADVTNEEEVKALVEKAVEALGSVDIMVANAGIGTSRPLVEMTEQQFSGQLAVNVTGVFNCYKFAAQQMIKQGKGGRLIAASSIWGRRGTVGLAGYCASKFAVRGLTQTAAVELKNYGITANTYAPCLIPTNLILPLMAGVEGTDEELVGIANKNMGLPDTAPVGKPENVAHVVSFLCKPESYFTTGHTLPVDGGLFPS